MKRSITTSKVSTQGRAGQGRLTNTAKRDHRKAFLAQATALKGREQYALYARKKYEEKLQASVGAAGKYNTKIPKCFLTLAPLAPADT